MSTPPEFSRRVRLARVGAEPLRQVIRASETERSALARRFDLIALDRLDASVELVRERGKFILLHATLEAEFVQSCSITLDPVGGSVSERFTLLYGPPDSEPELPALAGDEPAFEPLAGDAIDIGEAVAQEFSLVLPPFPHSPGASVEDATRPGDDGRLGALAQFLARRDGEPQ